MMTTFYITGRNDDIGVFTYLDNFFFKVIVQNVIRYSWYFRIIPPAVLFCLCLQLFQGSNTLFQIGVDVFND